MNITIRLEETKDYPIVEEITRNAFWGCMDSPTCEGEHLLVHMLRQLPAFVPELNFVAEMDGKLMGHIIYSRTKIVTADNRDVPVLTFGPVSVLPEYKCMGIGSMLIRHSIVQAKTLGYRGIIIYGHPDYYPRFGFNRAAAYGITTKEGYNFDAFMALPLYDGAFDGVSGRYFQDDAFDIDPDENTAFDKRFPPKKPAVLAPIELITKQLPKKAVQALHDKQIKYVGTLLRYSGTEMLEWDGMGEQDIVKINQALKELGQPPKLLPTSPILQLAQMGIRIPMIEPLREKAGIAVYRVESEGQKYILKVFANSEDRREITNYQMLAALNIPVLPMLRHTQCALLLPDISNSSDYRLGCEEDLSDTQVATAIARWYKILHAKGQEYLAQHTPLLYDENDMITIDNIEALALKSNTPQNILWKTIRVKFEEITQRIHNLIRTITYNDFYWTNLVVAKDKSSAMMLDFNLLGKGYAYADVRNVTSSMTKEAAAAFCQEYGVDHLCDEEKAADAFLSPIITLIAAYNQEQFPQWAKYSLEELHSGAVLQNLIAWLDKN